MTFVAEDGTGLTNSNSFCTEAFFDTYHDDRGRDYSSYSSAQKQQALVIASDYLEAKFTFVGVRKLSTQAMEWPRVNAWYNDGRQAANVPIEVQEATAELAWVELSTTDGIAPNPEYTSTNAPIVSKFEQVGPIREATRYGNEGYPEPFRPFPFAEKRLRELIITGNRVLRV